jgi:hypothetical protein
MLVEPLLPACRGIALFVLALLSSWNARSLCAGASFSCTPPRLTEPVLPVSHESIFNVIDVRNAKRREESLDVHQISLRPRMPARASLMYWSGAVLSKCSA